MRLLQLSDIHFVESALDDKRYVPIEKQFISDIKDQNKITPFSYILICGDLAFSGKQDEYKRAKDFIEEICKAINCKNDNVLMVPGNHDLDRTVNKGLKEFIRKTVAQDPDSFIKACKDSLELKNILKALYTPFTNYYKFAKEFGCISPFENSILFDEDLSHLDLNASLSWEKELFDQGKSIARVVGVNTALLSGCGRKKEKEVLPARMWTPYSKDGEHINILMGHHPLDDISNKDGFEKEIDTRFHLQIFGHRHIESTSGNRIALKITSAAFEPEYVPKKKMQDKYYPVYNIIDLEIQDNKYCVINNTPVKWDWNDPGFKEEDPIRFVAELLLQTSIQRKRIINVVGGTAKEQEMIRSETMLNNMDYEHRRQVVEHLFPNVPMSASTANIEVIVNNVKQEQKTTQFVSLTEHLFYKSQEELLSKYKKEKENKTKK